MNLHSSGLIVAVGLAAAIGVLPARLAHPQSFDGAYKGSMDCEQVPSDNRIFRTSLAIIVKDGKVHASMTMFDVDGKEEFLPEMAAGTVDADGALRFSDRTFTHRGNLQADYTGALNAAGGTLTGTQVWARTTGETVTRTCKGTVVAIRSQRQ
jgi:hypothetical protein